MQEHFYLITGIASQRSLAYFIATELAKNPLNHLILSYQNERFLPRLQEYASNFDRCSIIECDVGISQDLQKLSDYVKKQCPMGLKGLVHAIAFAPSDQLDGAFSDCLNKDGFHIAHEISSYSLAALVQALKESLVKGKGSVLTLSYLGSKRVIPNYNVMGLAKASLEACVRYLAADLGPLGVRVNGVSAPPIRTLASSGIAGIKDMVQFCGNNNLLQRVIGPEEIATLAAFLLSDAASAITAEIIMADGGFSHACPIKL